MERVMSEPGRKAPRDIGAVLTIAARLHRARAATLLGEIGLHPGQERALELLAAEGGMPMGALAEALRVRPPTASKMIARLAQQGLVARAEIAGDARRVQATLTNEGRKRLAQLPNLAERLESELIGALDNKDRRRLRKLLRKISRNLGPEAADGADLAEPSPDADEPGPETISA
jgi:DNA-binding MarR family transcriptional regulator